MQRRLTAISAAALMLALLAPAASASAAPAIHVRPGQSIQAAINGAPAGGVIHVGRGIYYEDLEIVASGVHLVGDQVVLLPPAVQTENLCTTPGFFDGLVGICIHGAIDFGTGTITPIADVSIDGFTVRGFGGPGIVAIGVDGLQIADVATTQSGEMGMFINNTSNVSIADVRSFSNAGDGVFLELDANVAVTGSTFYDNAGSGIMLVGSLGGRFTGNDVRGNCAGILVASAMLWPGAAPEQFAAGNVAIERNEVTANNRWCLADGHGAPDYGGIGIALVGAENTRVTQNDVRNNRTQAGSAIPSGGIVIVDAAIFAGFAPTDNVIARNRLAGNTPFDIFGDGSGSGNSVSANHCYSTNIGGC